jgi:N-formylglutamate deformylase
VIFSTWAIDPGRPVLATAIHAGHDLRPEVAELMALPDDVRRREEDPHTDELAAVVGSHVAVHRSRFEVDLNRHRPDAVYVHPEHAWGLDVWSHPPGPAVVDASRALHDEWYARLGLALDDLVARHGGFVLLDVHSYNHRREGPGGPPADPAGNPEVNLGTGSMPPRWAPVADAFLDGVRAAEVAGTPIDARENVRFEGQELARFVHERYGEVGCALAIEFKKTFMDEWTDEVDADRLADLGRALAGTVDPIREAHQRCR